jgi:hypothetical protein
MKNRHIHIIIGLFLFVFISCIGIKTINKTIYIGNFKEHKYGFFESFRHTNDQDYFYDLPFELKFGGIRPYPFDSIGKQDYNWLRDPSNLRIAFNSVKLIGLDKFVSFKQFNKKNTEWCCNTQREDKSLNDIVKGFLHSDTLSDRDDYYSKFWQRRKKENNLKETWQIFQQIDDFYNSKKSLVTESTIDTTLYHLFDYDIKLIHSDSLSYPLITLEYFDYLKKVKLDYSAYKLIFHNSRLNFPKTFRDSLLSTMSYDTLSFEDWKKLNDNVDGWITGEIYPDPLKNYGP